METSQRVSVKYDAKVRYYGVYDNLTNKFYAHDSLETCEQIAWQINRVIEKSMN